MRHLLVLLAAGIDEVLRFDPDPILSVAATSTDDVVTWGMECPDCIYTRAVLRGGESYRLFGNRGTARYVGLQTMNGIAATANELVDELEVDADGNFEVVLSADQHDRKLDAHRGRASHADGAALLLRLGHRGAVVAAHRADGRRGAVRRTVRSTRRWRCRGNWSPWATSSTTTWRSFCSSAPRHRRTASCRRSIAAIWAPPRKTGR